MFWILMCCVFCWVLMYDTRSDAAKALADKEEDEYSRIAELESNKPVTTGLQSVLIVVIGLAIPAAFAIPIIFNL